MDEACAAAEDAISTAHGWDAHLPFELTSCVHIDSKNPSLFGLPVSEQDIFDVGSNSSYK
jgi:hypothetical protein